jgi:hypothetical protein
MISRSGGVVFVGFEIPHRLYVRKAGKIPNPIEAALSTTRARADSRDLHLARDGFAARGPAASDGQRSHAEIVS